MTGYSTLVLEFEGETPDWNSMPEWLRNGALNHETDSGYLYFQYDSFDIKDGEYALRDNREVAEKIVGEVEGIRRIMYASADDTSDMGSFTLYDVEGDGIDEVETISSGFLHKAFEPDLRPVNEYFEDEHGFDLRFYFWDGLRDGKDTYIKID